MMKGSACKPLLLLLLLFLLPGEVVNAQLVAPLYGWTPYLSHKTVREITHRGDLIYTITDGGMFSYNPDSRAYHKFSTLDGMSNTSPNTIYTDQESKTVFIGYADGTINSLNEDWEFDYITDISRTELYPNKSINRFISFNQLLYIATEFGIVVYDIEADETRYSINKIENIQTGTPILDICIEQGRLWASVQDKGIYSVDLNLSNITVPDAWTKESGANGLPDQAAPFICNARGNLYAQISDTIFQLLEGSTQWTVAPFPYSNWVYINATEDQVFACVGSLTYLLKSDNTLKMEDNLGTLNTCYATGDRIWAGDNVSGLIWFKENGDRVYSSPPGPIRNLVTDIAAGNGELYIAPQGRKGYSSPANYQFGIPYYSFQNGGWHISSHRNSELSKDSIWLDFYVAHYDVEEKVCYMGSYQHGIVVMKEGKPIQLYRHDNSGLSATGSPPKNKVSGIAKDSHGNLWVTQMTSDLPLHVLTPDGQWYGSKPVAMDPNGIMVDSYDNKWIINQQNGLVVYHDNYTPGDFSDDRVKKLTTEFGHGLLLNNLVFSMAEDLDEQIWIGTETGVTIFYDPSLMWTTDFQDAACPIIDGFCLLRDQRVNDIAVDAANRKWLATETGVFLVNEDGTELLEHYTEENSPLISNNVKSVEIDPSTGEVFFGTAKGVISWMGDAIQGYANMADSLYTFPNPVFENHSGTITIKNMQQNSTIKITTASGLLVRELQSNGGEVPWDLRDTYGKRVLPGIYLVLVNTADGKNNGICKITVLAQPN